MTTRTARGGILSRRLLIAMVAMGIIAFALGYFVHPVYATTGATLQESQVGTDSSEATDDCAGAGEDVPAGMVLWHFILNGVDPGITSAIAGQFDFQLDGTLNVDSSKWNPGGDTHHFYVFTSGDDVLDGATADIGDSEYNNFVLSHICHGDEEEQSVAESASEAESVAESVAESEAQSGEQSVEAGTGTPEESVSDGALSLSDVGPLPTIAFSLILLASLGALAYANVKAVRS